MTTREPDRFEAKARELVGDLDAAMGKACGHTHVGKHDPGVRKRVTDLLAAALRAVESETLEWVVQELERRSHIHASKIVRALIPPAAAPAAEPENVWVMCSTDTDEHHGTHRLRVPTRREKSWCLDPIPVSAPAAEPPIRTVPMMPVDEAADARMDALRAAQSLETSGPIAPAQGAEAPSCHGCETKMRRIAELERDHRIYAEWAASEFWRRAWQPNESYDEWQARIAALAAPQSGEGR